MNVMTSPHSRTPPIPRLWPGLQTHTVRVSFATREVPYRWMTRQQVGS